MLVVRRRRGRWIHCVHIKTGDAISFRINEIYRAGAVSQVTIAILDDAHNYRILKPGERNGGILSSLPE
jgi:hypothetical protein